MKIQGCDDDVVVVDDDDDDDDCFCGMVDARKAFSLTSSRHHCQILYLILD